MVWDCQFIWDVVIPQFSARKYAERTNL